MIRLVLAGLFLALSLFVFLSEVVGFYKFNYVMNRMHAAACGDTVGIGAAVCGPGPPPSSSSRWCCCSCS